MERKRFSKDKILRLALVLSVMAVLLAMPLGSVMASNSSSKNFAELVWGDGTLWSMVAPPSPIPHPGASQGQEDFYEEAPQVPTAGFPVSPQSEQCDHIGIVPGTSNIPCYHDHTLGTVPGDAGFRALWHVYLVLCLNNQPSVTVGDSSCTAESITGTLLSGGVATLNLASSVYVHGTLTPLTSEAAINSAVSAGVVTIFDTGVTFICPVQPYSG
jgi:hypothetical protein